MPPLPTLIRRFLYLIYYFKSVDRVEFKTLFLHTLEHNAVSSLRLWRDILYCCFKYNISTIEYFYFRFHELESTQREQYAGTGYMYEYQSKMNPKKYRRILEDKILFLREYNQFITRKYCTLNDLLCGEHDRVDKIINSSKKLVLKNSLGQQGKTVRVLHQPGHDKQALIRHMRSHNFDLVEEYVIQHPLLMQLAPSGLNTVRIVTQLVDANVVILCARLRICIDNEIDNLSAGNAAAMIDIDTGKIPEPAVFSDPRHQDLQRHPITGVSIVGFTLPYWGQVIEMVKAAALLHPKNRSVGWDIAIRDNGPELIEANHNWGKLLWQLPAKRGLKSQLSRYS